MDDFKGEMWLKEQNWFCYAPFRHEEEPDDCLVHYNYRIQWWKVINIIWTNLIMLFLDKPCIIQTSIPNSMKFSPRERSTHHGVNLQKKLLSTPLSGNATTCKLIFCEFYLTNNVRHEI